MFPQQVRKFIQLWKVVSANYSKTISYYFQTLSSLSIGTWIIKRFLLMGCIIFCQAVTYFLGGPLYSLSISMRVGSPVSEVFIRNCITVSMVIENENITSSHLKWWFAKTSVYNFVYYLVIERSRVTWLAAWRNFLLLILCIRQLPGQKIDFQKHEWPQSNFSNSFSWTFAVNKAISWVPSDWTSKWAIRPTGKLSTASRPAFQAKS